VIDSNLVVPAEDAQIILTEVLPAGSTDATADFLNGLYRLNRRGFFRRRMHIWGGAVQRSV